jgi:glyoxylase-like metal-dependent hydrolase (beta-lactamase superfamily II)
MSASAREVRQVADGIYWIDLPVGHVYIWDWTEGLTPVDTGLPGSADTILTAIESLGRRPEDVKEVLLTHFHRDHSGSAASLVQRTGASVFAHPADAAIIAHRTRPTPPSLTELELRGTYAELIAHGARPVVAGALLVFDDAGARYFAEQHVAVEAVARDAYALWPPGECSLCASGVPLEDVAAE